MTTHVTSPALSVGAHRSAVPALPRMWPLNRDQLRDALDWEGIRPSAYSLDGTEPENRYVLTIRPGGWSVFFMERGREVDREDFDTEDEACSELLLRVVGDPTTRVR